MEFIQIAEKFNMHKMWREISCECENVNMYLRLCLPIPIPDCTPVALPFYFVFNVAWGKILLSFDSELSKYNLCTWTHAFASSAHFASRRINRDFCKLFGNSVL